MQVFELSGRIQVNSDLMCKVPTRSVFWRTDAAKCGWHRSAVSHLTSREAQMNDSEFQRWATLAQQSPAEFEAQRRQALLDVAMQSRHQSMLHTLVEALCTPCRCTTIEHVQHAQMLMSESLSSMQDAWAILTTTLVVDRIGQAAQVRQGPSAA
jgi:hypothetical protein